MIQSLVILGLLKKKPSSGYDIRKFMDKDLGKFSNPQASSIYYSLNKMQKKGLITAKIQSRSEHLKKCVYSITAKGEKEFSKLCRNVLLSQKRPFIELDIALYFLPFLDKKEIMPLLRLRLRFLERVKKWLKAKDEELKDAPRNLTLLISHQYQLAATEKEFLKSMIKSVKQGEI
ncbi:MAG: PadR family transcriptional regulator [Candidatus Omnitrophota bacterium]